MMLKEEKHYDFEWLDELPSDIEFNERKGYWVEPFKEWIKSDRKVIKIMLKNADDKRHCYASLKTFMKKNNFDYTLYCEKGYYNIYVVRA